MKLQVDHLTARLSSLSVVSGSRYQLDLSFVYWDSYSFLYLVFNFRNFLLETDRVIYPHFSALLWVRICRRARSSIRKEYAILYPPRPRHRESPSGLLSRSEPSLGGWTWSSLSLAPPLSYPLRGLSLCLQAG